MVEKKRVAQIVLIAMSALFNLAFGVAALIVHLQNNSPDPLCGNSNSYLSLSRWLEGFGIANILIFIGTVVVVLLLEKAPVLFSIWSILVGLFGFAWMIVGSVVLWRDDGACQATNYALWAMAAACVIQYYILIFVNCIVMTFVRKALAD